METQNSFPAGIPEEVCLKFEELARQVKRAGHARFSSDAILHQLRWHYQIDRGMRDFKCNNYWTSTLSRWCMERNPDMRGLFETRRLRSTDYPDDFFAGWT